MEDTTIENALKTFEDFYLKKDYPNALLTLQKAQKLIPEALRHYNLGIVYRDMQNWPMARYHLILAQGEGLNSDEVIQNQTMVEKQLDVARLEQPLDASDYLIKGSLIASQGPLTSLSLVFLVGGIWILKRTPSFKKAMLFILIVLTPIMLNLWISSWPRKIVTQVGPLYDGPSGLFNERGEIPAGLIVLTQVKGDWEEIVFPSRFRGWIKSNGLKKLE